MWVRMRMCFYAIVNVNENVNVFVGKCGSCKKNISLLMRKDIDSPKHIKLLEMGAFTE